MANQEKKPDPLGPVSPKDQGDTKDWDYAGTAPKHLFPVKGHDTYEGLPGDGIVPG